MKVKVSRYADYIQEIRKKREDAEKENGAKVGKIRGKEYSAKQTVKANKQRSDDLDTKMAYGDERQNKANFALQGAIKTVTSLKNGDGFAAMGDRHTASGMLARLRIAQAHADNTIKGLTKKQKKNVSIKMLHEAVTLATGSPTETNLGLAIKQIKDTTAESTRESYEKIDIMNKNHENDQKAFAKKQLDAELMKKHSRENNAKKTAEKSGKRQENLFDGLVLPSKKLQESYDKKTNQEARSKWTAHEERVIDEMGVKSVQQTQNMIIKEADGKKVKAAKEKTLKEECAILEKKKMGIMEGRNKAVASFTAERKKILTAQEDLNGVKYEEETTYMSKGPECSVRAAQYFLNADAGAGNHQECQEKCTEMKDKCEGVNYPYNGKCVLLRVGAIDAGHPECVMNENTGVCETNPPIPIDCTLYQKISGPGSPGYQSHGRMLLIATEEEEEDRLDAYLGMQTRFLFGSGPKPAPKPTPRPTRSPTKYPTLDPEVASGMARANSMVEAQGKHEATSKSGDAAQAREIESAQKNSEAGAMANEGSAKQSAMAAHVANEKEKKTSLADAERKAHNAEGKMQEMNTKAADADTQSRHCEGEMYRRRRTCACDDQEDPAAGRKLLGLFGSPGFPKPTPAPGPAVMSEAEHEVNQKKMDNWERRRYVRRRAVTPSPSDRRRRFAFPAPAPPVRVPSAICPCPKEEDRT